MPHNLPHGAASLGPASGVQLTVTQDDDASIFTTPARCGGRAALPSTSHTVTIAFSAYLAAATIRWLGTAFGATAVVTGGASALQPAGHADTTGHTSA